MFYKKLSLFIADNSNNTHYPFYTLIADGNFVYSGTEFHFSGNAVES